MQYYPPPDPPQPFFDDGTTPQPGDIVHGPRVQDVASTRDRKWHRHGQNVLYRNLVTKTAPDIDKDDQSACRSAAERIVDLIWANNGGVFVKSRPPNTWIVMDRKDAIIKTQQAIRNYNIKVANGGWYKKKTTNKQKKKKGPPKKKKKQPPSIMVYQAQAGDSMSIHPYALVVIDSICNATNKPGEPLHVLDYPMSQCFKDVVESRKERTMRLQLRHRYAGALAMGISPIDFSEKLLALWGGSLTKVERLAAPPSPQPLTPSAMEEGPQPNAETAPAPPTRSVAFDQHDETSAADALMSLFGDKKHQLELAPMSSV